MKLLNLNEVVNWSDLLEKGGTDQDGIKKVELERQHATAEEILTRLSSDEYPGVLLADEVGMGKTFVALATMATFLRSSKNAKVLLVVPQSEILKSKWMQDIETFDTRYLRKRDLFRPAEVDGIMDLLRATNEYQNEDLGRISREDSLRYAFLNELYKTDARRSTRDFDRWVDGLGMVRKIERDFSDGYQRMSAHALQRYFSEIGSTIQDFKKLLDTDPDRADLNGQIKEFMKVQRNYLPNVFVLKMSSFVRTSQKLRAIGTTIFNVLCKGRRDSTFERALGNLQDSIVSRTADLGYARMCSAYIRDFSTLPESFGIRSFLEGDEGQKFIAKFDEARGELNWSATFAKLTQGEGADLAHKYLKLLQAELIPKLLQRVTFSFGVVDEVHNWKRGTANGATQYRESLKPIVAKSLLLSATPFQIDPIEFQTIYDVAIPRDEKFLTTKALQILYGEKKSLVNECVQKSTAFHDAWMSLSTEDIEELKAEFPDGLENADVSIHIKEFSSQFGRSRNFSTFIKAFDEYGIILTETSKALGHLMIRHTKERARRLAQQSANRVYHSGHQFQADPAVTSLPQYSTLPAIRGYTSPDEDLALFEFISMRFDQLLRDGEGKGKAAEQKQKASAHLMNGLTSSFSAFAESKERKSKKAKINPELEPYNDAIEKAQRAGLKHPKVEATCARILANWEIGRKTLVFCYRVQTVNEIEATASKRINARLNELRKPFPFLKGDLKQTLSRQYFLREDRIWLSLMQSQLPADATLKGSDWYSETCEYLASPDFTKLFAEYYETVDKKSFDRNRRLMWMVDAACLKYFTGRIRLKGFEFPAWLKSGLAEVSEFELVALLEAASVSRKGNSEMKSVDSDLDQGTRRSAQDAEAAEDSVNSFIVKYLDSPSVWFGAAGEAPSNKVQNLHLALFELWRTESKAPNVDLGQSLWLRGQIIAALRNVILRPDMVIRLLTHAEGAHKVNVDGTLAENFDALCARTFSLKIGGQTIVDRVIDFLAELNKATGSIDVNVTKESRRRALFSGALLRRTENEPEEIRTLTGKITGTRRAQICQAFNSPLLPDILVCTSIGQEGIDLHLYCSEIIHHDLPWNPAVLEQRTGRIDRVRSLSERALTLIEIGVPFMGNNYDQFQYDVLVERVQKFAILMGDKNIMTDWHEGESEISDEGDEGGVISNDDRVQDKLGDGVVRVLPDSLVRYLEMDLSVWPGKVKRGMRRVG